MQPFLFSPYYGEFYTLHAILNDFMGHWDIENDKGERKYVPLHIIKKQFPAWVVDMCQIQHLMTTIL